MQPDTHALGEPMLLAADLTPMVPAAECRADLKPDPAMSPIPVPNAALIEANRDIEKYNANLDLIAEEFASRDKQITALSEKFADMETALVEMQSTLALIRTVLIRKLGPLN